jgi:hypothetical protein
MQNEEKKPFVMSEVPWQIWVIVALLGLEGIGNLLSIASQPVAVIWLGAKVLFITGLLKRWKWVYVVFIVIAVLHVVAFAANRATLVAAMNAALIILALWVRRYYFPHQGRNDGDSECVEQQGLISNVECK